PGGGLQRGRPRLRPVPRVRRHAAGEFRRRRPEPVGAGVGRGGERRRGRAGLAVGSGAGQPSLVKVYRGTDLSGTAEPPAEALDPFAAPTPGGVFVG